LEESEQNLKKLVQDGNGNKRNQSHEMMNNKKLYDEQVKRVETVKLTNRITSEVVKRLYESE